MNLVVVFLPQSFREHDVGIADVVKLHIVHFGNVGNGTVLFREPCHHLGVTRVEGGIIGHIGTVLRVVSRQAEPVDGIPSGILAVLQHGRYPCMILQSLLVGDACSSLYAFGVEATSLHADACQSVRLPLGEELGKAVGTDLFRPSIPSVNFKLVVVSCLVASHQRQQRDGGENDFFHCLFFLMICPMWLMVVA